MENPRPEKVAVVDEVRERLDSTSAALLTEYRGLDVTAISDLRRALRQVGGEYKIYKNTLVRFAARDLGLELEELLTGPTALAFITEKPDGSPGDAVDVAKALRDFARTNPNLVVKGGVLGDKPLSADEARALADVEPREVLLAKLAGAMQASLQNAVSLFAAPLAQTARVIEALRQKAEQDPSVLRGGAGTPAAAQPEEETVEPEAAPVESEEATPEVAAEERPSTEAAAEETTEG
jgi:large subunit ribosomal protein L10